MRISVIIPVYNVESYIERCLISVLNQSDQDIEIILVDDCSPDNSMAVALRIIDNHPNGCKVRVITHPQNRGLSAARNTGTREAHGQYVYYLDSDDEITPCFTKNLVALIDKYKGVEIIQGNTQTIPTPSREKDWRNILYKNFPEHIDQNKWVRLHFYNEKEQQIPVNATNKLINRKFILENNFFFKEGIIHEDDMWMFFVAKKLRSIAFTKEYTYIAYSTPGSIMQSGNNYRGLESWLIILTEIFKDMNDPYFDSYIEKYLRIMHTKMCSIDHSQKGAEQKKLYKELIKETIKKLSEKKRKISLFPLYILLTPHSFYSSYLGKVIFDTTCRLTLKENVTKIEQ